MARINLGGSYVITQSDIPIPMADIKGDAIEPLMQPALIKVNPSADMDADIHIIWGDKPHTEGTIKAWETLASNILVRI